MRRLKDLIPLFRSSLEKSSLLLIGILVWVGLFFQPAFSASLPVDSLVAWWSFDDTEDPYRGIGNLAIGTPEYWETNKYNSDSLSLVDGARGKALEFAEDGSAYLVTTQDYTWPTNAFTIAGWAKPYSVNTDGFGWLGFVSFGGGNDFINNFNLEFRRCDPENNCSDTYGYGHSRIDGWVDQFFTPQYMVEVNKFHFVAVTYNGTTLSFYRDGTKVGNINVTKNIQGFRQKIYLGVDFPGTDNYFEGVMDEITLWSTALSAEQIQILYQQNGSPVVPLPGAGLLLGSGLVGVVLFRKKLPFPRSGMK